MVTSRFSVVVIGGGPAGLSAAIAASVDGASVLLIERDARLGGTLKQCIHDGFGLFRFEENLTGPEYALKEMQSLEQTNAFVLLQTFVSRVVKQDNVFYLTLTNRHGIVRVEAKSIVLATGCRERTSKLSAIHGSRPAGVFTAGSAQYYANILGQLPARRALIFGSGNIGMIMARRLSLEGASVLGVYEPKKEPEGLLRNVVQCLNDFDIPLHFNHTVTRISGTQRLKSAEIYRVDKGQTPIAGTMNRVDCDSLIVSAGLIPENELADNLGVPVSKDTGGPTCDQNYMTMLDGVFCCGNSLHIFTLADDISDTGDIAGRAAARYITRNRQLIDIGTGKDFLYVVPKHLDFEVLGGETNLYFRSRESRENVAVKVFVDGQEICSQEFLTLRPQETEKITVNFKVALSSASKVELRMEKLSSVNLKGMDDDK